MTPEEFTESLRKDQLLLKSEKDHGLTGFVVRDSDETDLCALIKKDSINFAIRIKGMDGTFLKIGDALHMSVEQARQIASSLTANGPVSLTTIEGRPGYNYFFCGKFPPIEEQEQTK